MNNVQDIIEEAQRLSFSNRNSFPVVIEKLLDAGIERYYADLVILQKTYYSTDESTYTSKMPYSNPPVMGENFSKEEIVEAIRESQRGEIDYNDFLDKIIKAGCVYYTVFFYGKQAHYVGAKGEIHIEYFPPQND